MKTFFKLAKQTLELHLCMISENETRAEKLRELIHDNFGKVSETEQLRLKGLSADLYLLEEEEIESVKDEKSWDLILENLRTDLGIAPHVKAYLRALAWESFGERKVAKVFAEFACNDCPDNQTYKELLGRLL